MSLAVSFFASVIHRFANILQRFLIKKHDGYLVYEFERQYCLKEKGYIGAIVTAGIGR